MNNNLKLKVARTFVQKKRDKEDFDTPTLKHIAKKAGVSFQTVSHALNNTGRVSEKTRDVIGKIVSEIHYTPNAIARGLKVKTTKTLGIIFPCIYDNEFYAGIYRGIEDVLLAYDYNIILCNTDFEIDRETKYLRLLQEKRVDGVVLAPAIGDFNVYENSELIRNITSRIPVILVDRYVKDVEADYVGYDNLGGAHEAVEHLIKLGHKRIGCIVGPKSTAALERLEGYKKALKQYGIAYDEELVRWFEHPTKYQHAVTKPEGYYCARELIRKNNPPTGIFAVNDTEAIAVMKALDEERLRVPKDIAVVGYEDMRIASHLSVSLTTVRQDLTKMGAGVAEIFLKRMSGECTNEAIKVIIPNHLVVRESCGSQLVNRDIGLGQNSPGKEVEVER
ncbi:LacI family DNA-binding transcriptional regulator [Candidatus Peregrinibacteria bacterium]|nr:LacI family DNA-binding transcriptional regulator [Candidatus Peregrinibacteria bacterium]